MTSEQLKQFKHDCPKVYKFYRKALKQAHKHDVNNISTGLETFVLQLKFMRDYYIMCTDFMHDERIGALLNTLVPTIQEYEDATNCIANYFKFTDAGVPISDPNADEQKRAESLAQYIIERRLHKNKFWQLVASNIESWDIEDV